MMHKTLWVTLLAGLFLTMSAAAGAASSPGALEADWLFQADGKPTAELCQKEIQWTRELAARLAKLPKAPNTKAALAKIDLLEKKIAATSTPAAVKALYFDIRRAKREIMFANPAVDFDKVVLIDNPYPGLGREPGHEARHRNGFMANFGGRLVVLNGLNPDASVKQLAPTKKIGGAEASFWRPDVSWDGKKIVFCMKPEGEKSFHIYEVNADGSDAKQLTKGDYDDLDPIFLPDGKLLFCTTRGHTYIRCMPYTHSFMLARCDADGKNIYVVSRNSECDYTPSVTSDGRVIYTRWEYTDKGLWRVQSLWSMNPDGTDVTHFYGNQSAWPDILGEARSIPGTQKIMFIGMGHHRWFDGPIGIVDPSKGMNYPDGVYLVTPDKNWAEVEKGPKDQNYNAAYHASGKYGAYKSPYPLSEELFLVSALPGEMPRRDPRKDTPHFQLYLMDTFGNRELVWKGKHNAYYAMPLRARTKPQSLPDLVDWPGTGKDYKGVKDGMLYSNNVFEGVPEIPRDSVKALRIIEMDHKTYSTWWKTIQHDGPAVSLSGPEAVKWIYGTVPVEKDGSVAFKLPPGRAFYFQLIDKDGMAIQTMRSFTGVMPGESRGCMGCHELRPAAKQATATAAVSDAVKKGPATPTKPAWGEESIGYVRFVQPVLDKHCIKCHDGKNKKTKLNLTLRDSKVPWRQRLHHRPYDKTAFKEPYVYLIGGKIWWGKKSGTSAKGVKDVDVRLSPSGCYLVEGYSRSGTHQIDSLRTIPPMSALSTRSKLVKNAMSGKHHKVKVSRAELDRLIAWVDCNGPYLGSEEIAKMYDPQFTTTDIGAISARIRTAPKINRFNIRQDGDTNALVGKPVYAPGKFPSSKLISKPKIMPRITITVEMGQLIKAIYGTAKANVDVTKPLLKLIRGNVVLSNYNEQLGVEDPAVGTPKTLWITYKTPEGKTKTLPLAEWTGVKFRLANPKK